MPLHLQWRRSKRSKMQNRDKAFHRGMLSATVLAIFFCAALFRRHFPIVQSETGDIK